MTQEPGQPPIIMPSVTDNKDERFGDLKLDAIYEINPQEKVMQVILARAVAEEVNKVRTAENQGSVEVLEIGTGDGVTARQILETSPNAKVVGTDTNKEYVGSAKEGLAEFGERLEIQDKDAIEFLKQFPDNSVSLIASAFTIHNMKNDYRKDLLVEIFRVLKPGGSFITGDKIVPDDEELFQKALAEQMARFQAHPDKDQREKWIQHYNNDIQPDTIMLKDELIKILEEIGFSGIIITNRDGLQALLRARK